MRDRDDERAEFGDGAQRPRARHSVDPNVEETARGLGADTITMYRRITLPLIKDGIVSGAIFAFVLCGTTTTSAPTSPAPRARTPPGSTGG
ncbi:hypothetical protein ACFQL0_18225 [Haloplanus litoreus]|uniref:hypothetical protein n=1 Tax=Haloplanus litoreus TaxID=767515 RepID=UPI003618720E